MKRLLFTLGLLLIPLTAHALPTPAPWLTQVIERTKAGIAFAQTKTAPASCDPESHATAIGRALDPLRAQIDTEQRITLAGRDLSQISLCLRNDLVQLEELMNQLQGEIVSAADTCNISRIDVLADTYDFVVGAYDSLRSGGTDPAYQDDRLTTHYTFQDGKGPTKLTDNDIPLCPFNSDYLPTSYAHPQPGDSSVKSYGCDVSVITDDRSSSSPMMKESAHQGSFGETQAQAQFLLSFEALAAETDFFVRQTLSTVASIFSELRRGAPADPSLIPDVTSRSVPTEHAQVSGCLKLPDLPQAFTEKQVYDYIPTFDDRLAAAGDAILPIGLLFQSAYSPFSFYSNSYRLISDMVKKQVATFRDNALPLPTTSPDLMSDYWAPQISGQESAAADQAQSLALADAVSRDTYERMHGAFAPINRAIIALDEATAQTVPHFVRDFTYLLERTCVDTHCSENLRSVMKRILNPYCTPYASDLYKDNDAAKKCFCLDPAANGYTWSDYDTYCKAEFSPAELKAIDDNS